MAYGAEQIEKLIGKDRKELNMSSKTQRRKLKESGKLKTFSHRDIKKNHRRWLRNQYKNDSELSSELERRYKGWEY